MGNDTAFGDTAQQNGAKTAPATGWNRPVMDDQANRFMPGDADVRRQLETVMPAIASTLTKAIGTDSCAFYVYDETSSRTVAAFRFGYSRVVFPSLADHDELSPEVVPVEAELLRTKRTIRRFTEDDFRRWPMHNDVLRERAQRYSDIAVPLVWDDDVLGVVYLWRRGSTAPFNDGEIAIAEGLAQVAAMAVDFARRYGYEHSRRHRLDALLTVASLAASALTVEDVLPNLAHAVRSSTGADVCNLYIFDEGGENVEDMYSDGLNEREQWVVSQSDSYGVSEVPVESRMRRTLQPEVISDFASDLAPESELVMYTQEAGIRQMLIAPIIYQRTMIGVMYVWYRDNRQPFSEDAIQATMAIANQAGGVVSRARLHEASQRHIRETDALMRIGRAVLTGDRLEHVLDEIARVLAEMIPYDYAYVALLNEQRDAAIINRAWGDLPEEVFNQELPLDGSLTGAAIVSGQLVNVSDAHADKRSFRFKPKYLPIRSAMIAPLATEHGVIGALYIGSHAAGGFSSRRERLMSLLSQQAALAIERMEARETLARRSARQTFLATVADRLASSDGLENALPDIAHRAPGVLAEGMLIGMASWEYGRIDWAGVSLGSGERTATLTEVLRADASPWNEDVIEQMLLQETPFALSIDDCYWVPGGLANCLRQLEIARMLIVPMREQGRSPGMVILLESQCGHTFQPDVIEMTELVASRIADAVERRQMSRNRGALLRASEGMNLETSLDELLTLIARELNEIIPYDSIYVGERDEDEGVTRPLYVINACGHTVADVALASNEGLTGETMREQEPLLDNQAHLRATTRYASDTEAAYFATHGESVMSAPLIAQDAVVGVLFLGRTGEHRFTRSDFETFKLFAGLSASAIHRSMLVQRNQAIYRASVEVLAAVVDARDPTAHQHSRNVAYYGRVCAELLGLDSDEVEQVELAGLLHDVGKLGLPDEVLGKAEDLTSGEQQLVEDHPVSGAAILSQHPALSALAPLVRHHHEHYDGSGYPDRLSGNRIPFGACIIAVANAFEHMISALPERSRLSVEEALVRLQAAGGTKLHPDVVEAFVREVRSGNVDLASAPLTGTAAAVLHTVTDVPMDDTEESQLA